MFISALIFDLGHLTFQDALLYMDSQKLERQMLDFVEKRYKFSDADEDDGRDERKPQAVSI